METSAIEEMVGRADTIAKPYHRYPDKVKESIYIHRTPRQKTNELALKNSREIEHTSFSVDSDSTLVVNAHELTVLPQGIVEKSDEIILGSAKNGSTILYYTANYIKILGSPPIAFPELILGIKFVKQLYVFTESGVYLSDRRVLSAEAISVFDVSPYYICIGSGFNLNVYSRETCKLKQSFELTYEPSKVILLHKDQGIAVLTNNSLEILRFGCLNPYKSFFTDSCPRDMHFYENCSLLLVALTDTNRMYAMKITQEGSIKYYVEYRFQNPIKLIQISPSSRRFPLQLLLGTGQTIESYQIYKEDLCLPDTTRALSALKEILKNYEGMESLAISGPSSQSSISLRDNKREESNVPSSFLKSSLGEMKTQPVSECKAKEKRVETGIVNETEIINLSSEESQSAQIINKQESLPIENPSTKPPEAVLSDDILEQMFESLKLELAQEMQGIVQKEIDKCIPKIDALVAQAKSAMREEMNSMYAEFKKNLDTLLSRSTSSHRHSSEDRIRSIFSSSQDQAMCFLNQVDPSEVINRAISVQVLDSFGIFLIQLIETRSFQKACEWLQYVLRQLPTSVLKQEKYSDAILFTRNPLMKQIRNIYSQLLSNSLCS